MKYTPFMYRIVGADQKEYGPVTAEQIHDWITQGRANAQTVAKFEEGAWKPLATFPEFAGLFPTTSNVPSGAPPPIAQSYSTPPLSTTPGFGAARPNIPNYLVWSILTTLCCCLPTGIVAIIYSAQVNNKLDKGDIAGAERASMLARNWCIASAVAGLVCNLSSVPYFITHSNSILSNFPH